MPRTHSGCLAAGGLTRDPTSRVVSSASKASVSLHSNMPTSAAAEIEEGNLTKPGESALPHSISTTVESCVPRLDTGSPPPHSISTTVESWVPRLDTRETRRLMRASSRVSDSRVTSSIAARTRAGKGVRSDSAPLPSKAWLGSPEDRSRNWDCRDGTGGTSTADPYRGSLDLKADTPAAARHPHQHPAKWEHSTT